jgi:hypothetical protein
MSIPEKLLRARFSGLALAASLFISACGGGSSTPESPAVNPPVPETGTVGLLFTDKPTDEFSAIKLNVVEAILIGDDNGQQVLFQGSEPIDLLDLTNFNEPIVFGEVTAGVYTKLRLVINDLELVPLDGSASIFPKLPANGKIDLLDPSGIPVLPGRTLLVEIDMEANKAIKVTGAGNSKNYNFRPVVKANFMDGGDLPDKLARLEGNVDEIFADPPGSFRLCDIETPESCITVNSGTETSVFDDEGASTDINALMVNDTVVVIGRYGYDSGTDQGAVELSALIVEIGGNSEQIKGNVVSAPAAGRFLMLADDDSDLVIELQAGTKFFDAAGPITSDAVVLGADIEVEGVRPPKDVEEDPDLLRAALVFVEAEEADQLSGTIILPEPDPGTRSFMLTPLAGNDTCVNVAAEAVILFVDTAESEVTIGAFEQLAVGQDVDLFGESETTSATGCFEADEVIVEGPPPAEAA